MHALSIPTWIVHVSSVLEWAAAIFYIWQYGEITGDRSWYNLSFAMLPALVSAMCACTWHFFDNAASLEWLVIFQASMTVVGNLAVCLAAWGIWRAARHLEANNYATDNNKTNNVSSKSMVNHE